MSTRGLLWAICLLVAGVQLLAALASSGGGRSQTPFAKSGERGAAGCNVDRCACDVVLAGRDGRRPEGFRLRANGSGPEVHVEDLLRLASHDADRDVFPSAYIQRRLEQGAKPATVRNEIGMLGRMFTLAHQAELVPNRPRFPSLQVRNTRAGFFEERELWTILVHLPDYVRDLVLFAPPLTHAAASCALSPARRRTTRAASFRSRVIPRSRRSERATPGRAGCRWGGGAGLACDQSVTTSGS